MTRQIKLQKYRKTSTTHKRKCTPLGPRVTETASASLLMPESKPSLHSLSKAILFGPAFTTNGFFFTLTVLLSLFLHNPYGFNFVLAS